MHCSFETVVVKLTGIIYVLYTTQNLLRITVVYKHIFVHIFIVMKIAEIIRHNCKNSLQYKNKHFTLQ